MLESKIEELIVALNANTAAFLANCGVVTAPAKPARAPKPAAAAPAAAPTQTAAAPATARQPTADTSAAVTPAQITAAGDDLTRLANELGARDAAIAILGEFGVQKMTAMPPANIPEFHAKIKAAIAKLEPAPAGAPSLV